MKKIRMFMLLVAGGLCLAACNKEAVSDGYQDRFDYTSTLEKKYATDGRHDVRHESHDAVEPRWGSTRCGILPTLLAAIGAGLP